MSNYVLRIITDLSKFQERVDEINNATPAEAVKHAVSQLKQTLIANKDLVGLCAPQIGINLRIFCIKTANNRVRAFLNPLLVSGEGLHLSREVNPSFPDKQFIIPRKDKIHVAFQEVMGQVNSESYSGPYAEIVQQMIEMLDGILLSDYGLDLDDVGGPEEFDKASEKDKQALIQMYLESLKASSTDLKAAIDANPELKQINDNIDFMTEYLKGDIKPVDKDGNIVDIKKEEEKK